MSRLSEGESKQSSPKSFVRVSAPSLQSKIENHFMTLSALASTFGGIVRPICFAVFRLITNSNFVGCSTGRSAGFAPFRIFRRARQRAATDSKGGGHRPSVHLRPRIATARKLSLAVSRQRAPQSVSRWKRIKRPVGRREREHVSDLTLALPSQNRCDFAPLRFVADVLKHGPRSPCLSMSRPELPGSKVRRLGWH